MDIIRAILPPPTTARVLQVEGADDRTEPPFTVALAVAQPFSHGCVVAVLSRRSQSLAIQRRHLAERPTETLMRTCVRTCVDKVGYLRFTSDDW